MRVFIRKQEFSVQKQHTDVFYDHIGINGDFCVLLKRIIDFFKQIEASFQVISKSIDQSHNADPFLKVLVIIIKVAISKSEESLFEKSENGFLVLEGFSSVFYNDEYKVKAYLVVALGVVW